MGPPASRPGQAACQPYMRFLPVPVDWWLAALSARWQCHLRPSHSWRTRRTVCAAFAGLASFFDLGLPIERTASVCSTPLRSSIQYLASCSFAAMSGAQASFPPPRQPGGSSAPLPDFPVQLPAASLPTIADPCDTPARPAPAFPPSPSPVLPLPPPLSQSLMRMCLQWTACPQHQGIQDSPKKRRISMLMRNPRAFPRQCLSL